MRPDDIAFQETKALIIPAPKLGDIFKQGKPRIAWVRYYIQAGLLVPFHLASLALFSLLPNICLDVSGRILGRVLQFLAQCLGLSFARNLVASIQHIKGGILTAQERDTITKRWWRHRGLSYSRLSMIHHYMKPEKLKFSGLEELHRFQKDNQRVLLSMVHLGDWESVLDMSLITSPDVPLITTYQPQPNNFENWIIYKRRKHIGFYAFPPGQRSARHITKLLKADTTDLILFVDEVNDGQSRFPLFGRVMPETGNVDRLAKLARKYQRPVLPAYLLREPAGQFTLTILPAITPQSLPSNNFEYHIKQQLNEIYEPIIRKHLDQWYMLQNTRF